MVQMNRPTFSEVCLMSIIVFSEDLISVCDMSKIGKGAEMWLLNPHLTDKADKAVKALVTVLNSTSFYHKGELNCYSAIV